jgi:hypothetical protein
MCKILAVANAKALKMKSTARIVARIMQDTGYQKDGYGYAVLGKGGVYGERGLFPNSFKCRFGLPKAVDLPWVDVTQNSFGEFTQTKGAAIFHGRTSTNTRSLLNTHPIVKHGWTLIHNGVVTDHGDKYEMITTNDSEHVLERLVTGGIKALEDLITGYYAIAAFDPEGNLHIVKDSTAQLYSGFVKKLDSYVFGTSLNILESFEKELKLGKNVYEPVKDNTYLVFDTNGQMIHMESFQPRGYGKSESQWSQRSLGYSVGKDDEDFNSFLDSDGTQHFDREYKPGRWSRGYSGEYESSPYGEMIPMTEEEVFWSAVDNADASTQFLDFTGQPIDHDEFEKLPREKQIYCTVVLSDGTRVYHPNETSKELAG